MLSLRLIDKSRFFQLANCFFTSFLNFLCLDDEELLFLLLQHFLMYPEGAGGNTTIVKFEV